MAFIFTLTFWLAAGVIIFYLNPYKADTFVFYLLFGSLFFALLGTTTLLGFYLRLRFSKKEAVFGLLRSAFRQGALVAFLFLGFFAFFALNIFNWWIASLYIAVIFLLELISRTK